MLKRKKKKKEKKEDTKYPGTMTDHESWILVIDERETDHHDSEMTEPGNKRCQW
jgi:hypothetical protein